MLNAASYDKTHIQKSQRHTKQPNTAPVCLAYQPNCLFDVKHCHVFYMEWITGPASDSKELRCATAHIFRNWPSDFGRSTSNFFSSNKSKIGKTCSVDPTATTSALAVLFPNFVSYGTCQKFGCKEWWLYQSETMFKKFSLETGWTWCQKIYSKQEWSPTCSLRFCRTAL
jgi:hypothetical protein